MSIFMCPKAVTDLKIALNYGIDSVPYSDMSRFFRPVLV